MNLSIIVAAAENNAIGMNNELLWHLSEDLKRFKKLTTGQVVIMGKKTFFSLPVRPLPNRRNIVLSDDPSDVFESCDMAYSIEDVLNKLDSELENFVIGGGMVYRSMLEHANKIYLTRVHKEYEADTYFPEISGEDWELIEKEDQFSEEENFKYSYLVYQRR